MYSLCHLQVKGTVMQIEEALIIDRSRVLKESQKVLSPASYNFAVVYP